MDNKSTNTFIGFPNVDSIIQGFTEHLVSLQSAIMRIAEDAETQRQTILRISNISNQSIKMFEDFGQNILESMNTTLERAGVASTELGEPLGRSGFWIPPSAPLDLLWRLEAVRNNQQDTPEAFRQVIVDYYEEDDSRNFQIMVEDWSSNSYFAERAGIVEDAANAHKLGNYTLSIPALLPLIEGILSQIVGRRVRPREGMARWAEEAIDALYSDIGEAYKDALIHFIVGNRFYGTVPPEYFTPERFPEWLELEGLRGSHVLNRHAILHGVQIDYASRENSLRAFLMLDVLAWMRREEWDERFRTFLRLLDE